MTSTGDLRASGGVLSAPAKVLAIATLSLRRRFTYLSELIVRTGFVAVVLFVFAQLWRAIAQGVDPRPGGYGVAQLVWYLAFAEVIVFTGSGSAALEVDREVRSGDIAYRLTRPISYPLYHLAMSFADRLLRCATCLAVGATVSLLVVGPINLRPLVVAVALVAALLAVAVDELISLVLQLLSFWIENTAGLHMLYRRANLLLGGAFVPLEAYPEWLARVCRALPMRYLVAGPARLFVSKDTAAFIPLIGAQAAYGASALLALVVIYHLGLRRVTAQGG